MKNAILIIGIMFAVHSANAQTVTLLTDKAKMDSALYRMTYNNVIDGTFSNPIEYGDSTIYLVDIKKWNPDEAELDTILNMDGHVEDVALVLKFPQTALGVNVSSSLPYYQVVGTTGLETMKYAYWFNRAGLYAYNSYCYVLGIDWLGNILSGTELKQILNLSPNAKLMGQYDSEFKEAQANGIKAF